MRRAVAIALKIPDNDRLYGGGRAAAARFRRRPRRAQRDLVLRRRRRCGCPAAAHRRDEAIFNPNTNRAAVLDVRCRAAGRSGSSRLRTTRFRGGRNRVAALRCARPACSMPATCAPRWSGSCVIRRSNEPSSTTAPANGTIPARASSVTTPMNRPYTIATLGSHSALQILKGAHDEGFKTLAVVESRYRAALPLVWVRRRSDHARQVLRVHGR